MCIRDRGIAQLLEDESTEQWLKRADQALYDSKHSGRNKACLLYTSDAADERSSVDLGGRRIIKKK